jgi:Pectate lyase superfamily protein
MEACTLKAYSSLRDPRSSLLASICRLLSAVSLIALALWPMLVSSGNCRELPTRPSVSELSATDDEFVGPFANWADLKRDYGALGDGKTDDTSALQKALDDLKADKKSHCLYLPAGTYRLTRGLQMVSQMNFSLIGENPVTTIIKWDGPQNGTMLFCNGARYGRFGRLTWDGSGRAQTAIAHQWDGHTPNANTHNEHADEVFQNVGFGIRAGVPHFMDAECPILRCHFVHCSKAGVSIESFNACDWWVWYSVFEDCCVGVTNDPGAGNFHVYESLFRRSAEADIKMSNCSFFGIRHNTSVGSKAFFIAGTRGCSGSTTLQGNTVLDPIGPTAIQIGNVGPCLLVDNVVRSNKNKSKGEHAVYINEPGTALSIGNTFTMPDAIDLPAWKKGSNVLAIDDKVVNAEVVKFEEPVMPGPLPNRHRQVFEVVSGSDTASIQGAIDAASLLQGAVVHLQSGEFKINSTLTIPANNNVQLTGDGYQTRLKWSGTNRAPLLRLAGPSRAVVRDLEINGSGVADGVMVEACDQPGARIFMEQGEVSSARECGLLVDGLNNAQVELRDFYHSGCKKVAVKVVGWPGGDADRDQTSRVTIFGGASSSNTLSYDVVSGGSIVAEDIWYEGAPPRFIHLTETSSGNFTLNGATTATGRPGPNMNATKPNFAALEINGFRGNLTLINVNIGTNLIVDGDSKETNIFAMLHGYESYFANHSTSASAVLFGSTKYAYGGGAVPIPNQGKADPQFILKMLAPLRRARPHPLTALESGLSDVRFFRVNVTNCVTDVHVR